MKKLQKPKIYKAEYIKNIKQEEIKDSERIPGLNEPQIVENISIEGAQKGSNSKMLIFDRPASIGIGVQQFVGFGFKPSSYKILCIRNDMTETGKQCYSDGGFDGEHEGIMQISDGYSRYLDGYSLRLLYDNQGGGRTSAQFYKFIEDGIELDFNYSEEDCTLFITAFK